MFDGTGVDEERCSVTARAGRWRCSRFGAGHHRRGAGDPADAVVLATSGEHSDAYFEVVEELYFNAVGSAGPPIHGSAPTSRWCRCRRAVPCSRWDRSPGVGRCRADGYDNPVSKLMSNVIERFLDPDSTCCPGRHALRTELIGSIRSQPGQERPGHGRPPVQPRRSRLERPTCVEQVGVGESPRHDLHRSVGRRRSTRQEATPPGGRSC